MPRVSHFTASFSFSSWGPSHSPQCLALHLRSSRICSQMLRPSFSHFCLRSPHKTKLLDLTAPMLVLMLHLSVESFAPRLQWLDNSLFSGPFRRLYSSRYFSRSPQLVSAPEDWPHPAWWSSYLHIPLCPLVGYKLQRVPSPEHELSAFPGRYSTNTEAKIAALEPESLAL